MLTAVLQALGRSVSPAEKSARASFCAAHPESRVAWSTVKEEPARYVVGIFYGVTRPPRFKFYTVSKPDLIAAPLEHASTYMPKKWR